MFIAFVIILLVYLAIMLTGEKFGRRIPSQTFNIRKISHMMIAVVTALLPLFLNLQFSLAVGIVLIIGSVLFRFLKFSNALEKNEKSNLGTTFFPLGIVLTALFFWDINPVIFSISALILGFADGLAGLVGRNFGKHNYRFVDNKTIEGSLTFFGIASLILISSYLINPGFFGALSVARIIAILISSAILTIIEGASAKGIDNVAIPFFSALLICFLVYL